MVTCISPSCCPLVKKGIHDIPGVVGRICPLKEPIVAVWSPMRLILKGTWIKPGSLRVMDHGLMTIPKLTIGTTWVGGIAVELSYLGADGVGVLLAVLVDGGFEAGVSVAGLGVGLVASVGDSEVIAAEVTDEGVC